MAGVQTISQGSIEQRSKPNTLEAQGHMTGTRWFTQLINPTIFDLMALMRCIGDLSWPLDLMTKASMRNWWTRSVESTCSQSNMLHMAQSSTSFQASNQNKTNGNWVFVNLKTIEKMEGASWRSSSSTSKFWKFTSCDSWFQLDLNMDSNSLSLIVASSMFRSHWLAMNIENLTLNPNKLKTQN